MVTPPLPRAALFHTCTYLRITDKDIWGKESVIETALTNVRIEPYFSRSFSLSGNIPQYKAKLFWDSALSQPRTTSFKTGDKIRFRGEEYTISEVYEYYALNKLHHLEVMLV